jgi:hypothetical protein
MLICIVKGGEKFLTKANVIKFVDEVLVNGDRPKRVEFLFMLASRNSVLTRVEFYEFLIEVLSLVTQYHDIVGVSLINERNKSQLTPVLNSMLVEVGCNGSIVTLDDFSLVIANLDILNQ